MLFTTLEGIEHQFRVQASAVSAGYGRCTSNSTQAPGLPVQARQRDRNVSRVVTSVVSHL